ncbi:MAG: peptide chain release factor N(5)-glutamine methyltransferase [Candidatus Staskawiczbacteria bacterium]|jgi:release factor glutamine methyltransferase
MTKEVKWLLDEKYNGKKTESFYKDVKRLEAGEPVDYVIGFTEFLGCKIDLSKKPLIPRPETEYWVCEEIKRISRVFGERQKRDFFALDMFAGSGCIGIAILRHVKNVKVIFADKSQDCVKQIKINLKINHVKKGFIVRQSDIFSNIKEKADYIFANPPYIPTTRRSRVGKSVLKFEPHKALFAGKNGLFFINKFLKDAKKYLNAGGIIFMEFDGLAGSSHAPSQKKEIEKLIKKYKYSKWEFKKDQYNRWRWVEIQ